jgi:hypothetical protein
LTKSQYFVYERTGGNPYRYDLIGTVDVNDNESARATAIEKYYKDTPELFLPKIRVSTKPLGDHSKECLANFLPKKGERNSET